MCDCVCVLCPLWFYKIKQHRKYPHSITSTIRVAGRDGTEEQWVPTEEEGIRGAGEVAEEGWGEEEVWGANGWVWAGEGCWARETEEDWGGEDPGEAETPGGEVRIHTTHQDIYVYIWDWGKDFIVQYVNYRNLLPLLLKFMVKILTSGNCYGNED